MSIRVESALFIHGQGARANNEDSLYPDSDAGAANNNLFIVCDGVGGMTHGELASKLACTKFAAYFWQINPAAISDEAYIDQAMAYVQQEFDTYLNDHPEARGMATTLTLLHLHDNGATVAHVGDSRVYHIRQGDIIWHTEDHSVVNDYVKHNIITPEQAESHPDRNKITRAIQGSDVKKAKADVRLIPRNELRKGDYFLLCSDGMLEAVSDLDIETILAGKGTEAEKVETINELCLEKSSDNYTAYIVKLGPVSAKKSSGELSKALVGEVPAQERVVEGKIQVAVGEVSDSLPDPTSGGVGTNPVEDSPEDDYLLEERKVDEYIESSKSGNRFIVTVFLVLILLALVYYLVR